MLVYVGIEVKIIGFNVLMCEFGINFLIYIWELYIKRGINKIFFISLCEIKVSIGYR